MKKRLLSLVLALSMTAAAAEGVFAAGTEETHEDTWITELETEREARFAEEQERLAEMEKERAEAEKQREEMEKERDEHLKEMGIDPDAPMPTRPPIPTEGEVRLMASDFSGVRLLANTARLYI